jgi:hypothetical protein
MPGIEPGFAHALAQTTTTKGTWDLNPVNRRYTSNPALRFCYEAIYPRRVSPVNMGGCALRLVPR